MDRLDAAKTLLDLNLPGMRLEKLAGDREGQYSIRINGRIVSALNGAQMPTKLKLPAINRRKAMAKKKKLDPIHPGEHIADILQETGMTANALAIALRVPANRITAIIHGKRGITADTALRLARYFGTSPEFWMNFQTRYDLQSAEDSLADLDRQIIPRSAA